MSRNPPDPPSRRRAVGVGTLVAACIALGTATAGPAQAGPHGAPSAPVAPSASAGVSAPLAPSALNGLSGPEGFATTSIAAASAAAPIGRSTVVSRAQAWVSARPNVPYNQDRYFASPTNYYGDAAGDNPSGWREDCSGFVSQAWGIAAPGVVTATMPSVTTPISWAALQPGDALLRYDSVAHHTALFVKWDDAAHTTFTLQEEAGTATGTRVDTGVSLTNSWWRTFTPIRYDNITNSGGGTTPRRHDYTRDANADVLAKDAYGNLRQYAGNGTGGFMAGYSTIGTGLATRTLFSGGDFTADGNNDVMARDSSGNLLLYPGGGTTLTTTPSTIGVGWQGMTALVSDGDFTGDGHPDVLARESDGSLRLYPGNGAGRLTGSFTVIGSGWSQMTVLLSVGDFTGDGRDDVIARDAAGRLLLYPGTGAGLSAASVIGIGWEGMTAIIGAGDFSGDGRPDILARDSSGNLLLYPGAGAGRLTGGRGIVGVGWSALSITP